MTNEIQIEQAKKLLKSAGYYVDNLWHVDDVRLKLKMCSDKEAYSILNNAMRSDAVQSCVFECIEDEIMSREQEPNPNARFW